MSAFEDVLFSIAEERRYPRDAERLGARVHALSEAYNTVGTGRAKEHGAARLLFWLPRDIPKTTLAVRELVAAGLLRIPAGRPLRVKDHGAGLGASTWGLLRALEGAGESGVVSVALVDDDEDALDLARDVVRKTSFGEVSLRIDAPKPRERFDVILLGQVLSELHRDLPPEERLGKHEAFLRGLMESELAVDGSLVIVEPALRERSRHLHKLRDRLAAQVFAPCLHANPCPMLLRENDWCHEDHPVDLPPELVPVAKAAGLRWQGLTFAYLVLRRDGRTLRSALTVAPEPLRLVSEIRRTKGKSEALVCGPRSQGRDSVMRLDRDATATNATWDRLHRGDLLAFTPPDAVRVGKDTHVTRVAVAGATELP
jgi:hypothetical protein